MPDQISSATVTRPVAGTGLRARVSTALVDHRSFITSGSALVAQATIMAATGALFWLIAARLYPAAVVGEAAGLVTLVLVGDYVSSLGLPIVVARFGTSRGNDSASIFTLGLVLTSLTSALTASAIIAVASPSFAAPLLANGSVVGWCVVFLAINGLSCTTLLDNRMLGLGLERSFLMRHAIAGVGRLALVATPAVHPDALWIWMCTTLVAMPLAVIALVRHRRTVGPLRIGPVPWREVIGYGAVNMASALLAMAPFMLLPLIVFAMVAAESNAAFHVAWTFATVAFLVPTLIGRALLISSSTASTSVAAQTRASLGLCTIAAFAIIGAATPALVIMPWAYGSDYRQSAGYLLLLLAGLVPYGLTATALGAARIAGDTVGTLVVSAALAVGILVPGVLWTSRSGTMGAALGWVCGHATAGIVSATWLARSRHGLQARGAGAR